MSDSFSPRFVRAKVAFQFNGKNHQAGECLINSDGLSAIPWKDFDPQEQLGKKVTASIQALTTTPLEFSCDALITSEQSAGAATNSMGLTFLFKPGDRARLDTVVSQEGVLPEFVRKIPRIHYIEKIPVFPSRAIIRYFYKQEDIMVACNIENISPSGLMVNTDDARTEALLPNETVRVQIQPRGPWQRVIAANAQIKRVMARPDTVSGNIQRSFGLAVTTMSGESKASFTDLLKQIVIFAKK